MADTRPYRIALPAYLLLGGCSGIGVLDPQGPIGGANRIILINAVVIMLAIVIPTIAATFAFAWWYRASNEKARYRPDFAYSGRLELLVWSIPVLVVLFLGGITWIGSHQLDPATPIASKEKTVEVQVVALDWKWLFIYPENGVASVNDLVVPAGVPVHFSLTSASVMNSFFVPQLGSMIYAMNGMVTQLNLQADHPGSFRGIASHFSGDGFSDMHFTVRALPPAAFAQWSAATRTTGAALDRAAYDRLAQQSENVQPFTYHAVQPGLFQAIATQKIPQAPGPSPTVSPRTER